MGTTTGLKYEPLRYRPIIKQNNIRTKNERDKAMIENKKTNSNAYRTVNPNKTQLLLQRRTIFLFCLKPRLHNIRNGERVVMKTPIGRKNTIYAITNDKTLKNSVVIEQHIAVH